MSFGGCAGQNYACTDLVFDFTLLSMITVPGTLWISDEDGVYEPVPGESAPCLVASSNLSVNVWWSQAAACRWKDRSSQH